jgi:enoyl-CoA hydratase
MNTNGIKIEKIDNIAVLRFDRPPANAIDLALAEEVETALSTIEGDTEIGALIITGAGNCFSAGLDLKVVPTYDRGQQQAMIVQVNRVFGTLYGLSLPAVVAVNGHVIAGGLVLALACDYRIGAEGDYKIGLAEVRVGVPFPAAAITVVRSELSKPVARMMVLTGRNSTPREALAQGIFDELQPADQLLPRALEVARELAALPRIGYARIKRQLRASALSRIDDAIRNRKEPMLDSWLSDETSDASARALKRDED